MRHRFCICQLKIALPTERTQVMSIGCNKWHSVNNVIHGRVSNTWRDGQHLLVIFTIPHGQQQRRTAIGPHVIGRIPAVKMHQHIIPNDIFHCRHTDHPRISLVHCFELQTDYEIIFAGYLRLLWRKKIEYRPRILRTGFLTIEKQFSLAASDFVFAK